MNYLTVNELARTQATTNYQPRKLTKVETIIKHAATVVFPMPNDNQQQKADKAAEVEITINAMAEHTSNEMLLAKLRLAMHDRQTLNELVVSYPFVNFEGLLNGTDKLSNIERYGKSGYSVDSLRAQLLWAHSLVVLMDKLPKGIDTFIWTKVSTGILFHATALAKKENKYFGYILTKEVQEEVDTLIVGDARDWNNRVASHQQILHTYDLLNVPSIWKRAVLDNPEINKLMEGVKFEFHADQVVRSTYGYTQPVQVLTVTNEGTNTKLHFVIPG